MKFGNILKANIQPEYEMYYIQYNNLKKNIIIDEFIFIKQLKMQIDIVEKFYNQNKNEKDLLNFSLLNLFAILKIVKKFNKKNEINITKIIHHYYIKKNFYKDLFDSTIEHNQQNINDECIVCYEKNQYLVNPGCNHNVCWNCSLKLYQNNFEKCIVCQKKINSNPLIQKLEELTQIKCNSIYHKGLSNPPSKKLVFLGIDGLRPDCLLFAKTPTFDEIIRNGTINFDTEIITHAISGQSWCTILSGSKDHNVYFNEEVEDDLFQWNIENIFTFLNSKKINTSSFTGNWEGIKNITKDAKTSEFFYSNELLHNDKQVIHKTISKLFEQEGDEFIFSYIGGIDKTGHNYGFSMQTEEYIEYIEKIDQLLYDLFKIIQKNNYSLIVTTDHGGSKYTDFTEGQSSIFDSIDFIKGQKENKCKGIHGLEIPQHKRTFQIYYGNSYNRKEILGKMYSNHIYEKIVQYFKPRPPPPL